jgi:hypothetical protein
MKRFLLPVMLLGALAVTGCYSEEPAVGYSVSYGYGAPTMAYVAPGVQVIADYDYPIFYSDGFYWRWDGGYWYRSPYYTGGWVTVRDVPYGIRSVQEPWRYSHYHAGGGVAVTGRGPVIRDHRGYAPAYRTAPTYRSTPTYRPAPVYRPAPARGPVIRDHRH